MKKAICNDLLEYNTFSSRSITTKNSTKRKDLPSQLFQGGKQKYKVTSINEISKKEIKNANFNGDFNGDKENRNDTNSQIKHASDKLNKLDKIKEKFSKMEILKENGNMPTTKYCMDVMDYKNNYDTPRTEKRIEFLFSYPSTSNEEKRKTNFTEALNQIENKFSDLRINKDPKINEK